MAKDYGIKVMKEGVGISDTDIRNILMSSKYSMLKYHDELEGSITMNLGDTDVYTDLTHGLNYVPAFIAFIKEGNYVYNVNTVPFSTIAKVDPIYVWADSTKIRCGYGFYTGAYGRSTVKINPSSYVHFYDLYWHDHDFFYVGKKDGNGRSGAIKFPSFNVAKNTTIISATLSVHFNDNSGVNADLKSVIRGLDVDNIGNFDSVDPFSQPETTATVTSQFNLSSNSRYNLDVKSIVEEITTRSGWSSGNHIGFTIRDNGSSDGNYIGATYDGNANTYLEVVIQTGSARNLSFKVIVFKDKIT